MRSERYVQCRKVRKAPTELEVILDEFKKSLYDRTCLLDEWIWKNGCEAYDPFDGLNATILRWVPLRNRYLRIAFQQSIRRFPVNLRPIVGIKPEKSSKGMGFLRWAI